MKTINAKAVFIEGNPGKLTFQLSGRHLDEARQSGIKLNQVVELKVRDVSTSKSALQNNTFHDLLTIYLKSRLSGCNNFDELKTRIKRSYGHSEVKSIYNTRLKKTEQWLYIKSWAVYRLDEAREVITCLVDEMLIVFNENGYHSDRFNSMVAEWNEYKAGLVKPVKVKELEIF